MLTFMRKAACLFVNRSNQRSIKKLDARTKPQAQLLVLRFRLQAQAREVCLEIHLGQDLALRRHCLDKNQRLDLDPQVLKD